MPWSGWHWRPWVRVQIIPCLFDHDIQVFLSHLAIQFGKALGAEVVVFSHSKNKEVRHNNKPD